MRTFWEDLSKRIGETAESVSNKAGEAVEIQKLKNQDPCAGARNGRRS